MLPIISRMRLMSWTGGNGPERTAGCRGPWFAGALTVLLAVAQTRAIDPLPLVSVIDPRYVVVDDPALHEVARLSGYDGVAEVIVDTGSTSLGGSGALLCTGRHILTAAHLVDAALDTTVCFDVGNGSETRHVSAIHVHPAWTGALLSGADIAILELGQTAPAAADRYDIYRSSDEVGKVGFKAGYGRTGTGNTGETQPPPDGTKIGGGNRYDALADRFDGSFFQPGTIAAGTQLAYDFDNGRGLNDAFGYFFGMSDLGLGSNEVNSTPGDSGGPTFIDGRIAGITSYGFGFNGDPDVLAGTNSSFGEFSVDTRVSAYAAWIDALVPEPGTWLLMVPAVLAMLRRRR